MMSGTFSSIMRAGCCSATLIGRSRWGLADTIAAPDGTVISFTDSIPWASIFFKALRGVLPSTFQWFGWYTLFCFAMQGAAGALLCARGQAKTGAGALVFSTLGGLLFVMLPTLWERAFRHTALASQWLFLLALYAFLEYRQNLHSGTAKFPWAMPVLAFLAVGIHPYFLPLVMMCALLAAVELGRQKKAWGRAALQFAASLAAAVVGGVLCGAIGSGTRGIPLRLWRLFHESECTHQPNLPRGLHLVPAVPGNAAAARPV